MTPKYWIKIGIGMTIIFVVGLVVKSGFDRGTQYLKDRFPGSLWMLASGFQVGGTQVGDIRRVQLLRSRPRQVDSAVLTIALHDSAQVARFRDCRLAAIGSSGFNEHTRFDCVSVADSARLDLIPFGHVLVQPGDITVPLWLPGENVAAFRRDAFSANGLEADGAGDVDIRKDHAFLSINVNGRELFHFKGDSADGSVIIRDGKGRVVVNISDKGGIHIGR